MLIFFDKEAMDELEKQFTFKKNDKCLDQESIKNRKNEVTDLVIKIFRKKALGNEDEIKDYVEKIYIKVKEKFKEYKETNKMAWMVILTR